MSLIVSDDNENAMAANSAATGSNMAMGQFPNNTPSSAAATGPNYGAMSPQSAVPNGGQSGLGGVNSGQTLDQHQSNHYQLELRTLTNSLDQTNRLVNHLVHQIHDLRDHVSVIFVHFVDKAQGLSSSD